MFDLRYHVASLTAVFLALIIGILVGVGISGKGFVSDSERKLLNEKIDSLHSQLDAATRRGDGLAKAQRAAQTFVQDAYPALMDQRLAGRRIAVVFVGTEDGRTRSLVEQSLDDAGGGAPLRTRALKLPIDLPTLRRTLAGHPALVALATKRRIGELGRRLGEELRRGREEPALEPARRRPARGAVRKRRPAADGVVVARTVKPQPGPTARFLAGFYSGLGLDGLPAVGVERTGHAAVGDPGVRQAGALHRRRCRHRGRAGSRSPLLLGGASPATTASARPPRTASSRRSPPRAGG